MTYQEKVTAILRLLFPPRVVVGFLLVAVTLASGSYVLVSMATAFTLVEAIEQG